MIGRYWAWVERETLLYPRAFTVVMAVLGCAFVACLAMAFVGL